MNFLLKFAIPFTFAQTWQLLLFLALPGLLAALGAYLTRGSFLRIVGATLGAALRDGVLVLAVLGGYLKPTNPEYDLDIALVLLLLVAAGGALGATLAPYRGLLLLLMAALGAFAGQWLFMLFPLVLCYRSRSQRSQQMVML